MPNYWQGLEMNSTFYKKCVDVEVTVEFKNLSLPF